MGNGNSLLGNKAAGGQS